MTDRQKQQIKALRRKGWSYSAIADELALSPNTVKSCHRRSGGNSVFGDLCRNCGRPIAQNPCTRERHFCSNYCRQEWWNSNRDQVQHRDSRTVECAYCGRTFTAHGKRPRKYCSHACYAADRGG
ncbi:MAG: helix-turn-helix domain-containing protein [Oscillospiraceae bacterium]|nr:helix-turn-helix domain-containing protein [Oscillospiraceae bacterium]